jgi:hypothetical protein
LVCVFDLAEGFYIVWRWSSQANQSSTASVMTPLLMYSQCKQPSAQNGDAGIVSHVEY